MKVLLVADPGLATSAVESALTRRGAAVSRVSPAADDLFGSAVGQQAVVYLPAPNLLMGHLVSPGAELRVPDVLRASGAPGVALLVVALPEAAHFDATVDAVQRHGKPYVLVRAPGLLEEIAQAIEGSESTLWLPRTGELRVSRGEALGAAVLEALLTEQQGRVTEAASEGFDVAGLFAAASGLAGRKVRVRGVTPLVYRVVRPVARWLKGGEPPPLTLADQLLTRSPSMGHMSEQLS